MDGARDEQVERVGRRLRIPNNKRGLPEVVQVQGRYRDDEPREPDWPATELPHVGIERFSTRHTQDHRSQSQECQHGFTAEETHCIHRVNRRNDLRGLDQASKAEYSNRDEPDEHHWTEGCTHLPGPMPLHHKQRDKNHHGDWHNPRSQPRINELKPFNGRQHGNGRGNHAVAVEQRRTQDAQAHDELSTVLHLRNRERSERHDAAFAIIVGPHHDEHVLDRHNECQGPEHHRRRAIDAVLNSWNVVDTVEDFLERIQRASTDVAEHNTERT